MPSFYPWQPILKSSKARTTKMDIPIIILAIALAIFIVIDIITLLRYREFIRLSVLKYRNKAALEIQEDWGLLATGKSDDYQLEVRWLQAVQKSFLLFQEKNHDYGSNNLASGGLKGVALRMGDKVSRIWTLVGLRGDRGQKIKDESIGDSFMDLANYAIIGYLMVNGAWSSSEGVSDNFGRVAIKEVLEELLKD